MKTKNIFIIDGICDGISMQLFFKDIICRFIRCCFSINFRIGGILIKNRCSRETEELCMGEKFLYGFVIVTELRPVTFIEYKDNTTIF